MAPQDAGGRNFKPSRWAKKGANLPKGGQNAPLLEIDSKAILAPEENQKFGPFTVYCLGINRMIGTGIFAGASLVIQFCQSPFWTLILWFCGCVMALAGTFLFLEYALHTPRNPHPRPNTEFVVAKSGGSLIYLKHLINRPKYFAVCVFGVSYILFANVSGNSIDFARRLVLAAGHDPDSPSSHGWIVRAIALATCCLVCLFVTFWRSGGVWLNTVFACVKIAVLVTMIVLGVLFWGQVISSSEEVSSQTFNNVRQEPYAYARAFLVIIFAFDGFEQPTYVLGEVRNPKRCFKWPVAFAVYTVSVLYLGVIMSYFAVVPVEVQTMAQTDVALEFFERTLGRGRSARRTYHALMAISSLGNVIAVTLIAARVKQEIAKENIFPFRSFFMSTLKVKGIQVSRIWGSRREDFSEYVPLGGIILHFTVSAIAILLSAINETPSESYIILISLYVYSVDGNGIFGFVLALGMLWMRLPIRKHAWKTKSEVSGLLSVASAVIVTICDFFIIVVLWWRPSSRFLAAHPLEYPWYAVSSVGWAGLGLGVLIWLILYHIVPCYGGRGTLVRIRREIYFERCDDYLLCLEEEDGGYVIDRHTNSVYTMSQRERSDRMFNEPTLSEYVVSAHEAVHVKWVRHDGAHDTYEEETEFREWR